ncbi:hypothetical protein [Clostridium uliginosum]|uniref:Uncharacterized protein n=1 Tax=Clostridium uliginosum TaxID=119641 RepID=A0A1I1RN28_9CLOT|nr:hypothetical protein [Clostridium uliginosum]SFD31830.1 hypothetical protein SAMN05421842_1325 [Clostridium uliginosum]
MFEFEYFLLVCICECILMLFLIKIQKASFELKTYHKHVRDFSYIIVTTTLILLQHLFNIDIRIVILMWLIISYGYYFFDKKED